MTDNNAVTAAQAGLNQDDQIRLALQTMVDNGGVATTQQIYDRVIAELSKKDFSLSEQGKASLRNFFNRQAVNAGYVYPYDSKQPGWRITPEGREFLNSGDTEPATVINVDTNTLQKDTSSVVKGAAFERYVEELLKKIYPYYVWYPQGKHKKQERGLDFIGKRLGEVTGEPKSIGVQVKFHQANNAPTQEEWLKFLSGCFARRVESAIFITTGRLTGEQHREAGEATVIVIEGQVEIERQAEQYKLEKFEFFEQSNQGSQTAPFGTTPAPKNQASAG